MSLVTAALVALSVELTLKYNKVRDVHEVSSTGQLIPLVLGIALIFSTV